MGLKSGMLIGVPIPESHAPLGTQIEAAIQQALQDAKYVCDLIKMIIISLQLRVRLTPAF
jgi:pseudouridine-5'-phosphate glycosidase